MTGRNILKRMFITGMAIGCLCVGARATFTDAQGHWAEQSIIKWSEEYQVILGYGDGRVGPDDVITRGQFAGILDRFFQFQTISPANTFSDIKNHYWEQAILKLHASGVYQGMGNGKAAADSQITRQQAVTMLGRAFQIVPETEELPYEDAEMISDWAAGYVAEYTSRGYLDGNRGVNFRPNEAITRAEVISILDYMIQTLVQENVTLKNDVDGTLMINSAEGATLKNMTIHGDLIIAHGVLGTVTLNGVTVDGDTYNFSPYEPTVLHEPEIPEKPAAVPLEPKDIYTPGVLSGTFLDYSGYKIPIYKDRAKNTLRNSDFYWDGDRLVYTGREYRTRFGIDVSSYQGDIDWEAVASDGVEFAMIRLGYRGYGPSGTLNEDTLDKCYYQNVTGAMAAGIDTGVYLFAQAITIEEAIEEADYVIDHLKGIEISGPVCYDWEMHNATYRVYGTPPEMATACAVAFCKRIEEAGYTPMVYAGNYVSYVKYDQGAIAPYLSWYPEYKGESSENIAPSLVYQMDYWQYSTKCKIKGISGNVDVNLQFIPRH